MNNKKKIRHNYTSELELKSLLIRIKNSRAGFGNEKENNKINTYIKWHTELNNKKYAPPSKKSSIKAKLKSRIVELAELTSVDTNSYERFGEIILLMVKNVLRKPQFSGYTYKDDIYSDAVHKILKYLHNYNHLLISKITGQPVNAFAYISQIIHNSIIFIINTKNKEKEKRRRYYDNVSIGQVANEKYFLWNESTHEPEDVRDKNIEETIELKKVKTTLYDEIVSLEAEIDKVDHMNIYYPRDYRISFEEYDELKDLLRSKVSIMRSK